MRMRRPDRSAKYACCVRAASVLYVVREPPRCLIPSNFPARQADGQVGIASQRSVYRFIEAPRLRSRVLLLLTLTTILIFGVGLVGEVTTITVQNVWSRDTEKITV